MNAPELYEIRLAGHLSDTWRARFEGLCVRLNPGGETVLSGMLDQAALHGVLIIIRDLGLKLVSVNRAGCPASAGTASAGPAAAGTASAGTEETEW